MSTERGAPAAGERVWPAPVPPLVFRKASLLCYRLFDIADNVNLEQARALLALDSRRLSLAREGSENLILPNPPLTVELGRRSLPLRQGPIEVHVTARVFDHGAISVILKVPVVPGTTMEALIPFADELYDSAPIDQLAAEITASLRQSLASVLEAPHLWKETESYTVIYVEQIDGDPSAATVLEDSDLPRLMLGETGDRPLSRRERLDVIEHHFSYTDQDLVVVDWNSAFVYEPSGSGDIPDILEICNAQLFELRYYDDVLDVQLQKIYDQISNRQPTWLRNFWSPYKNLARRVLVTLLELSEFVERVENSLKIVGDFYLAKVYEAAVKQLRVNAWQRSVTRKQQLLAQTYQLLKGEVDTDRSLTLELTIVLLIVGEVFVALFSIWK